MVVFRTKSAINLRGAVNNRCHIAIAATSDELYRGKYDERGGIDTNATSKCERTLWDRQQSNRDGI
ncbi:hypothetical protein VCR31J2_1310255 [Vibrio coralliirubri]|uniref:Uncharacterized protein n=1 Tax=Vibrio coralliirubri TaxID=1516159 RepID=A0AA87BZX7_9VIBR|nr:hypothetical protein VCR31J2_1310255 [Vibrio coralliirubri]